MRHPLSTPLITLTAVSVALPAAADSANPFVRLFERLPLLTDLFGFLGLIARNWYVFVFQVFP